MPEPMSEAESFRRGIYPYTVNGVAKLGDPLKILNRIYRALPEFDELVDRFFVASLVPSVPVSTEGESGDGPGEVVPPEDPAAVSARGVVLIETAAALEVAVLAGFELAPLGEDPAGVSITEAIEILTDFLGWQNRRDAAQATARALAASLAAAAEAKQRADAESLLIGAGASGDLPTADLHPASVS